jgi:hypothetical protein
LNYQQNNVDYRSSAVSRPPLLDAADLSWKYYTPRYVSGSSRAEWDAFAAILMSTTIPMLVAAAPVLVDTVGAQKGFLLASIARRRSEGRRRLAFIEG